MISEMDAEPDAPVCILPQFGQITMVKGFATIDNVALIDVAVGTFFGGGRMCVCVYVFFHTHTHTLHPHTRTPYTHRVLVWWGFPVPPVQSSPP